MSERVLVIEDDVDVLRLVRSYLEREGFDVLVESDGEAGLRRALADAPDLVVLDWMLPKLDGRVVLERLRRAAPIPVIMLTARGDETDRVVGLELGADDYVTKPFSPRELVARRTSRVSGCSKTLGAERRPCHSDRRTRRCRRRWRREGHERTRVGHRGRRRRAASGALVLGA